MLEKVELLLFFIWVAVGGGVGYLIGSSRGRGPLGFWLGFLFGFIGWIIVAVLGSTVEHEVRRQDAVDAARGNAPYRSQTPSPASAQPQRKPSFDEFLAGVNRATTPSSPPSPNNSAFYQKILRAADDEGRGPEVKSLLDEFCSKRGLRPASSWVLADGPFGLALRQDGVAYLVASGNVRRVISGDSATFDESPEGVPIRADVDGIPLENLRPVHAAMGFLAAIGATRRTVVDVPLAEASSALSPPSTERSSVPDAINQLRQMRDDGLITEQEYEMKRQEILGRL
jgi:hypothetical protein